MLLTLQHDRGLQRVGCCTKFELPWGIMDSIYRLAELIEIDDTLIRGRKTGESVDVRRNKNADHARRISLVRQFPLFLET